MCKIYDAALFSETKNLIVRNKNLIIKNKTVIIKNILEICTFFKPVHNFLNVFVVHMRNFLFYNNFLIFFSSSAHLPQFLTK